MEPTQPTNQPVDPPEPTPAESAAPSQPSVNPVSEPVAASPAAPVSEAPQAAPTPSVGVPAAPQASGEPHMVVGGADQSQTATPLATGANGAAGGNGKKKWLWPSVAAGVVVVLLAGGFVFGYYLPNRPGAVYSRGLQNSGKAVDALVDYSNNLSKKNYKSYGFDGSLKVKSSSFSMDGTLTGAFDMNANSDTSLKLDVAGQNINADIRSLKAKGNSSPDVYVQLSGIKPLLDSYGASSLSSLDGQWISIDHTLIDTYAANVKDQLSATTSTDNVPTADQIHDAAVKVQEVNKQYLFTTDSNKAVLKEESYVGKETKDGRSVYHYKVNYDKAHLKTYSDALKKALDSSSLNDWSKKVNNGKNLSDAFNDSSVADSADSSTVAMPLDMWIDTKAKLVHAIQFRDSKDASTSLTISQNYTGGDEYPLAISYADKSTKGSLQVTINKATDKATLAMDGGEGSTTYNFDFKVTPSNNAVNVTAPSGAQPVMNVLGKLGLGGGF